MASERMVSLASMTRRQLLLREIRRSMPIYAFVLPGVAFIILFRYYPLYFLQIAFRDYRPTRALGLSPWQGWRYFEQLFRISQIEYFELFSRLGPLLKIWRLSRWLHHLDHGIKRILPLMKRFYSGIVLVLEKPTA